jgi:hypothetical protein
MPPSSLSWPSGVRSFDVESREEHRFDGLRAVMDRSLSILFVVL